MSNKFNWNKIKKPRARSTKAQARSKKGYPHACKSCTTILFSKYRKYCDFCLARLKIHNFEYFADK